MDMFLTCVTTIIGAVIGGLLAGYYSFKATKEAHQNQKILVDENDKKVIRSLLQAIHDELETVFESYHDNMGVRLESLGEGQPLDMYYPLVSDFFSVYNGNTFLLGRIEDTDLRKGIIRTYNLGKGMIDSFRMNNELLHKFEYWDAMYAETKIQVHLDKALAQRQLLVEYAKSLRAQHYYLKDSVKNTVRQLMKFGVLNEGK